MSEPGRRLETRVNAPQSVSAPQNEGAKQIIKSASVLAEDKIEIYLFISVFPINDLETHKTLSTVGARPLHHDEHLPVLFCRAKPNRIRSVLIEHPNATLQGARLASISFRQGTRQLLGSGAHLRDG